MPKLGAHVSAQGGAFQIFARGRQIGAECLQLFTRAPSQWKASPLTPEAIKRFKSERKAYGNPSVIAHDIYLNNLAAADEEIRRRSIETMVEELGRCHQLRIDGLVCHLGAHADGELGLTRYAEAIQEILERTQAQPVPILLETCAGQGTTLGHRLEHLARIIELNAQHPRLGVCVDTCHLFAAGYDLRQRKGYDAFWQLFDDLLGLARLKALHLNDSKKALGSRVDRHDHIGRGAGSRRSFSQDPRCDRDTGAGDDGQGQPGRPESAAPSLPGGPDRPALHPRGGLLGALRLRASRPHAPPEVRAVCMRRIGRAGE
jgi:deoxyribonuclease-4